jgi:hypothetical protein
VACEETMSTERPFFSFSNADLVKAARRALRKDRRRLRAIKRELTFRSSLSARRAVDEIAYLEREGSPSTRSYQSFEYDTLVEEVNQHEEKTADLPPEGKPLVLVKRNVWDYVTRRNAEMDLRLRRRILRITTNGEDPFKIGIAGRPGNRKGSYAKSKYRHMRVLCKSSRWQTIVGLEKRLISWALDVGISTNRKGEGPGPRPVKPRAFHLYIVV